MARPLALTKRNIEGTNARLASKQDWFPYRAKTVSYMELGRDGKLMQISGHAASREERHAALHRACAGLSVIYAVWPGEWLSDMFLMDDLDALADEWGVRAAA
jgi:hypothetical protein